MKKLIEGGILYENCKIDFECCEPWGVCGFIDTDYIGYAERGELLGKIEYYLVWRL